MLQDILRTSSRIEDFLFQVDTKLTVTMTLPAKAKENAMGTSSSVSVTKTTPAPKQVESPATRDKTSGEASMASVNRD